MKKRTVIYLVSLAVLFGIWTWLLSWPHGIVGCAAFSVGWFFDDIRDALGGLFQ